MKINSSISGNCWDALFINRPHSLQRDNISLDGTATNTVVDNSKTSLH